MRHIKPCPRPKRFPLAARTLNSTKAPFTVWFNHAVLVRSTQERPVLVRANSAHITVSIKVDKQVETLLDIPLNFGYLVEVSR